MLGRSFLQRAHNSSAVRSFSTGTRRKLVYTIPDYLQPRTAPFPGSSIADATRVSEAAEALIQRRKALGLPQPLSEVDPVLEARAGGRPVVQSRSQPLSLSQASLLALQNLSTVAQIQAMRDLDRQVSLVYEDAGAESDSGPAQLTDAQAQSLFSEIMSKPDSPFAYYFVKEFEAELARRYPDVEDKKERFNRFDQEVRARWWYANSFKTNRFQELTKQHILVNKADASSHAIEDAGRFFEVPQPYVDHYLRAPTLPAAKKFDPLAEEMFDESQFSVILRNWTENLVSEEFATSGSNRMMIREDALFLGRILKLIQQHVAPELARPSSGPCALPEAAPVDASSSSSSVSTSSDSILNSLEALLERSGGELGVDTERARMANTPGDLKSYWPSDLGAFQHRQSMFQKKAQTKFNPEKLLRNVYLLTGHGKCGRSTTMTYAALQARQNNWFVLHVPRFDLFCSGPWILAPSETHEGMFDQPLLAWFFFQELLQLEADKLKQIKLKGDYSEAKSDDVAFGARHLNYFAEQGVEYPHFQASKSEGTLFDLVSYAAQHRLNASRVVKAFVDEVEQITEFPVLVALDNINTYELPTGYFHPETQKPLSSNDLVFSKALSRFLTQGPKNGISITALTSIIPSEQSRHLVSQPKVTSVPIRPYSVRELQNSVLNYALGHTFHFPTLDRQFFGEISLATNRIPGQVRRHCSLLGIE